MNTKMLFTTILLLSATLITTACDDEFAPDEVSVRSYGWDDVVCTSGDTRCYGHRPLAEELWSPLVSHCDLNELVASSSWTETDDGYTQVCAEGGEPHTFADVRCFYTSADEVRCYGGFNGWYTEVGPSCDFGPYTRNTWKTGACDTYFGPHEYDFVLASTLYVVARAFDGPDRFQVVPECVVQASGVVADPFACL